MRIIFDEGYQFGLGVFETIAVERGIPVFLREHLERMRQSMNVLGIEGGITEEEVRDYVKEHRREHGALKILISGENKIFAMRKNPYFPRQGNPEFCLEFSQIIRNETSPLVCHKTLNYGDNILEKRRAAQEGIQEKIFCNTRGEICEGTCTNIFFVQKGRIYTPKVSCGLLPGIMRGFLAKHFPVHEEIIRREDLEEMEECFVTNSLMGVMPVKKLGEKRFSEHEVTMACLEEYLQQSCREVING